MESTAAQIKSMNAVTLTSSAVLRKATNGLKIQNANHLNASSMDHAALGKLMQITKIANAFQELISAALILHISKHGRPMRTASAIHAQHAAQTIHSPLTGVVNAILPRHAVNLKETPG